MSEGNGGISTWAVVELMGHQQIAGLCSEELVAGKPMLRVDVPGRSADVGEPTEGFTRYYGAGALYAITPCSEEDVRRVVGYYQPNRLPVYLPQNMSLLPESTGELAEEQACRVCGCTEDDCSACILETGEPCSWRDDLWTLEGAICSRCASDPAVLAAQAES